MMALYFVRRLASHVASSFMVYLFMYGGIYSRGFNEYSLWEVLLGLVCVGAFLFDTMWMIKFPYHKQLMNMIRIQKEKRLIKRRMSGEWV